jgi:hypothetical protein
MKRLAILALCLLLLPSAVCATDYKYGMENVGGTCPTHQWDAALSALGVVTCTQPASTDLSDFSTTPGTDNQVPLNISGIYTPTTLPACADSGGNHLNYASHAFTCGTSGSSGIACSVLPALTGDTTSSAGSCATTTSAVQGNSLVPHRVTTSGATLSVSLATSLNQYITLHDTITLTFSAAPADGNVVRFKLTQNNGGSHTVTWPASVKWSGGTAPTLTTTDGQADFAQCLYDGTTTNYMCSSVLNFTP